MKECANANTVLTLKIVNCIYLYCVGYVVPTIRSLIDHLTTISTSNSIASPLANEAIKSNFYSYVLSNSNTSTRLYTYEI